MNKKQMKVVIELLSDEVRNLRSCLEMSESIVKERDERIANIKEKRITPTTLTHMEQVLHPDTVKKHPEEVANLTSYLTKQPLEKCTELVNRAISNYNSNRFTTSRMEKFLDKSWRIANSDSAKIMIKELTKLHDEGVSQIYMDSIR